MNFAISIFAVYALASSLVAGPRIDSPVLATIQDSTLTIPGSGFGSPGPESAIVARLGGHRVLIPSTSELVVSWEDSKIVVSTDGFESSGSIRVRTPEGRSRRARVLVYQYDWFEIPPTPFTNPLPLAIEADARGEIWVNQEFHLEFQHLDPATGVVTGLAPPRPPNPGPFATTLFNDHRTQMSVLGEDVLVDPLGRVCFSQGGSHLYVFQHPNHSRVACYDPQAEPGAEWRVYNMPGDWNEIIGLAWDEIRGRIWVAQSGPVVGPALISFDPDRIPFDNHFDFSTPLLDLVCEPGEATEGCYQVFPLPPTSRLPAHMLVDDGGRVWYTAYFGNRIGVLHPATGRVIEYPLPAPIGQGDPVPIAGSGPWQMVEAPGGDIVFTEFFDSTISRFRASRRLDPACRSLDGEGRNPCITERVVPGADLRIQTVHSIAYDLEGRLWFGQTSLVEADASLGFVTPNWKHVVRLPNLNAFPARAFADSAGVAVDPTTGDIYFCEFRRQRIGRLRLL